MNTRHRSHTLRALLLGLLAACLSLPAMASQKEVVLGAEGEIYRVRLGTFGELFPGQKSNPPGNTVLSLDREQPGRPLERTLVPMTSGDEVESFPALIFEESSETVFVIWSRPLSSIHPVLVLAGFNGKSWLDPITLIGNSAYAQKIHPEIAVTRDSYQAPDEDGKPVKRNRTVLHLVWGEQEGAGTIETYYSPIIFEDGVYVGSSLSFQLSQLDGTNAVNGSPLAATVLESLLRTPTIQAGRDGRAVAIGFVAPASQRFMTVEVDLLPSELSRLGDTARAQIIDTGRDFWPGNRRGLADLVIASLLKNGSSFHAEVLQAIAEKVNDFLENADSVRDIAFVAGGARAQIIDTGAKFSARGLRGTEGASTTKPLVARAEIETEGQSHILQLRVASSRPSPPIGKGQIRTFLSENGERALISWLDGDRLRYRISEEESWSEPRELKISTTLSIDQAYEILAQKVRAR